VSAELGRLGTATVYEAAGREGLVDADLIQVLPGTAVAGPARTVRCGQGDNLMVHAAMAALKEGEVLVLTMAEPAPVALVGDLLLTQAKSRGAAGVLVDAAVRDADDLRKLGLPVWTRWVRVRGATKDVVGELDVPVTVGGARINPGDIVVMDADGAAVVPAAREQEVLAAARDREQREADKRARLQAGHLSYDLDGLREVVERG
jgi:4-hydroxy-4-methyl-2-oxoglutarate aldolase